MDLQKRNMALIWKATHLEYLDPKKSCEEEVQRIVHLQNVVNQLPNAFIDTKKVTKLHIPAANAHARIEIPDERQKVMKFLCNAWKDTWFKRFKTKKIEKTIRCTKLYSK